MTNEPQISRTRTLSPVWFIPLLAILIALWLAIRAWQAAGPVIQIEFEDAAGITVGKTHVRFRDVKVGEVKKIRLSDDFNRVQVIVEMDRQVTSLITDQSNFWVVSPRISLSEVSGIETLLSGVYIEMDSGGEGDGEPQSEFIGLEEPPAVRSYDEGTSYELIAETLGSLDIGSAIYHRQVPVGEVTGYKLLPSQGKVQVRFFVKSPYDSLVKKQSQFWSVSGFEASIGLEGVDLDVGSLNALVSGGVEFDSPPGLGAEDALADPEHAFYLFENRDAVSEGAASVSYPFLLRFSGTVRGLKVGAPVEYLGIKVGRVEHIAFDNDATQVRKINVVIGLQPKRMNSREMLTEQMVYQEIGELVRNGMQARLKSGSLIGGSLFVDLVPNAVKSGELVHNDGYPEVPTSENEYSQIARKLAAIVESVHSIPIEDIGEQLQGSLKSLRSFAEELQEGDIVNKSAALVENLTNASADLDNTFQQLEQALRSIDQTMAPDSNLSHTLNKTLKDISDASKSMEQLTDELYRYPDALLRGKRGDNE